jgi:hypothetical protein
MEIIWDWIDSLESDNQDIVHDDVPLGQASTWWETMVENLTGATGRLNLS